MDIVGKLPTDRGITTYAVAKTDTEQLLSEVTVDTAGNLTYKVNQVDSTKVGKTAIITVTASMENYENAEYTLTISSIDKKAVEIKSGNSVSVDGSNALTYGEKVSKLTLGNTVFVEAGTDDVIEGILSWSNPGRREIGHGALAERALLPVLPSPEEFPYAIRTVSETFESNGSTSMASTCASCMSLMAAGVPIKKMVAGISCGLVTGDTDDDYIVLTDIQGLEDFFGDMDFKVTGTTEGITAIQMDIKIHGLTRPIVEEAIRRTREARLFIMDTCMKPAIAEPRKEVGQYAPKIVQIQINPEKIGDVVGQRGKTINEIIARTGVKIDITDDGAVSVCGTEAEAMQNAIKMIEMIASDFEEGKKYTGTVVSIKEFGAFIEFAPGKEGMVHISKIAKERIDHVEDVLTLGDVVTVVCLGKDKMGRISFSIKDCK